MLDVSKDIHSLTDFKTKTPEFIDRLRASGHALLLTVNGRAELAVMSATTFQNVLNALDMLDALRGIRVGLDDSKAGRKRPAAEFFRELRKKQRTPRRGKRA